MRASPWVLNSLSRSGEKLVGQDECGGMYMLKICNGESLMVAVMARCSVVESLGNKASVWRGEYDME